MRKILSIILLGVSCGAFAQTLPTLLLVDSDARQAALCCPGEAARAEYEHLKAAAGGGIWSVSGQASTLLGAEAAYKFPLGIEAGISTKVVVDKPYEITNARGMVSGTFSPLESAFGVFAAYDVLDCLKAGLRARFIYSAVAEYNAASALGTDIYAVYSKGGLKASLETCNLGTRIDFGSGSYPQPSLVRACTAWAPLKGLLVAADADYLFEGALMAGAGIEYAFKGLVALRAGYHYGDASKAIPSYATLGAGLEIKGFSLDGVFLLATDILKGTAMFRIGYEF